MKRRIGIYALCLAGIMFLLHSVVPHHHHEAASIELEHKHAVEHVLHLQHEHDEEEDEHSDGHRHDHSISEHVIAADNLKQQQIGVQWHPLVGLPGTRILVPEAPSLSLGIELWGNATARVLSPHIIGHGLRAPPSV